MDVNNLEEVKTSFQRLKVLFEEEKNEEACDLLEELLTGLEEQADFRKAGKVDERGNISISDDADSENICISLNHIMELYIYNYWFKPDMSCISYDIPMNEYYRNYGDLCLKLGKYKTAADAYKKGICWNPVDLDCILGLGECFKNLNMLERFLIVTKQAYRYCCTRATMARYYRNMGYYYRVKLRPDVARACFIYSNIYYHTQYADDELAFLEKALNDTTPDLKIEQMQEIFKENDIEPGPDPDTIGVVYRVGEIMMENEDFSIARDCFSIVYDITMQPELLTVLDELDLLLSDVDKEEKNFSVDI